MSEFTKKQIDKVLRDHAKWLAGKGGKLADFSGADLRYADLRGADLRGADLRGADLRDADLRDADLRYADLRYADLRGADLRGADLRDADLHGVTGDSLYIKSIQTDKWHITYTSEILTIGCQSHSISEWWSFEDDRIAEMDRDALEWWKVWKPIIQAIITASPAKSN